MVGEYSAVAGAGGGYVWDEVLEYRVWCHPKESGDDYYYAYATYEEAREAGVLDGQAFLHIHPEYNDVLLTVYQTTIIQKAES